MRLKTWCNKEEALVDAGSPRNIPIIGLKLKILYNIAGLRRNAPK
jgi:hypothetical protein